MFLVSEIVLFWEPGNLLWSRKCVSRWQRYMEQG